MSTPLLGEIRLFAGNFAPRGWAFCRGQLLSIANYDALFALLGTTYGGDGQTTFALPDLQGRVPVGWGQGPGLSPYAVGQAEGTEAVTLATAQMPRHGHGGAAASGEQTTNRPAGSAPARGGVYGAVDPATTAAAGEAVGGNQPHGNVQPHLGVSFIIALEGIFPSRN